MEKIIIYKNKYKILINFPSLEQKRFDDPIIVSSGFRPVKPTNLNKDSTDIWELDMIKEISQKTDRIVISFAWFATSIKSKNLKNLRVNKYVKEVNEIMDFIKKKFKVKTFSVTTLSFAAVPFIIASNARNDIRNFVFRGIITNDMLSSFKWALKREDSILNTWNKNNEVEILKEDWIKNIENSNLTISKMIKSTILIGEFESIKRTSDAETFSKKNAIPLIKIPGASHNCNESKEIYSEMLEHLIANIA